MSDLEKKIKITLDATGAKAEIDALAARLAGLTGKTQGTGGATEKLSKKQQRLNDRLIATNRSLNAMGGLMRKVAIAASVFTGIRLADDFNELQNKLRLTTQAGEDLNDVQEKIVNISLKTRSSLKENGLLYLRLSNAVDRNVVSQKELLRVTETVNKAVQTGGSSAQEAAGAIRQFTQIVSSGFVSGFSQEINSLSEQTPGLFNLIVDGLSETSTEFQRLEAAGIKGVSALKTFSKEGIGNLDVLLEAIASQAHNVDEAFANIDITVSKAMGNVKTALETYIGGLDDATGATKGLALFIDKVALNFDDFANELIVVGSALAVIAVAFYAATAAAWVFNGGLKAIAVTISPVVIIIAAIALVVVALIKDLAIFEDGVVKVGKKTTDAFGLIKAIIEVVQDRFKVFFANIINFGSEFVGVFANVALAIWETFDFEGGPISDWVANAGTAIKDFVNSVVLGFKILVPVIKAVFETMTENIGKSLAKAQVTLGGFLEFIVLKGLGKSEKEIDRSIAHTNKRLAELGDKSPSKSIAEKIAAIIAGEGDVDYLGDAFTKVSDKISTGLSSLSQGILANIKAVIEGAGMSWAKFKADVESKIVIPAGLERINLGDKNLGPKPPELNAWEKLIGFVNEFLKGINAIGEAVIAFTGLFSTMADLRQDKIDGEIDSMTEKYNEDVKSGKFTAAELATKKKQYEQDRKAKEINAKKSFETSKKLTLAGIALSTGLAIMNALADTTTGSFFINAANAAGAAAMGASQYLKANAQQYSAPSAPSGGSTPTAQSQQQSSDTAVTINISGGNFGKNGGEDVVAALQEFFNNDGIAFDGNSAQGRVSNG